MKRILIVLACILACAAVAGAASYHTSDSTDAAALHAAADCGAAHAQAAAANAAPELTQAVRAEPLLGSGGAVRQCIVEFTFPDLQPSYPVNEAWLEDGTLEYIWEIVITDGKSYLNVGSRHFKESVDWGYNQIGSATPEEMEPFLYLWAEGVTEWQWISAPKVTVTGNTFAWKFLVPEGFIFDNDCEVTDVYVTIGGNAWVGDIEYDWHWADYTEGTGVTSMELWLWPGEALQASYPVNEQNVAVGAEEYAWDVHFTNGKDDLVISSYYLKNDAPQQNLAITEMLNNMYVVTEAGWLWIGSPVVELRGNAIVWTLPIPSAYGFTEENLQFDGVYICEHGEKRDMPWLVRWCYSPAIDASYSGSGQCGDNLTWSLNTDGVLTISGTGAMWDYANDISLVNQPPWRDMYNGIRKVILPDGLTYIGSYAFNNCKSLASVTLPASVEAIGEGAFIGSFILREISLPAELKSVEAAAFAFCPRLQTVHYSGTAEMWSAIVVGEANEYLLNAELQAVPFRCGDVNMDGNVNGKDVTQLRRHFAGGYGVPTPDVLLADVNGDGNVNGKDVTQLRRYLAGGYGVTLG